MRNTIKCTNVSALNACTTSKGRFKQTVFACIELYANQLSAYAKKNRKNAALGMNMFACTELYPDIVGNGPNTGMATALIRVRQYIGVQGKCPHDYSCT